MGGWAWCWQGVKGCWKAVGTICLEKKVAEMEVKGLAQGEQVWTVFLKYFWFKFESRVSVDPFATHT